MMAAFDRVSDADDAIRDFVERLSHEDVLDSGPLLHEADRLDAAKADAALALCRLVCATPDCTRCSAHGASQTGLAARAVANEAERRRAVPSVGGGEGDRPRA